MSPSPLPIIDSGRVAGIEVSSEPFRLMFPAGILAGVLGVGLWPLYSWELLHYYPGQAHARIMIGGFFGAMILGFLGTAGPRMLGVRPLSPASLGMLFVMWAGAVIAALLNHLVLADSLTLLVFITGFVHAGIRVARRQDLPPPGFTMVVAGLFAGFLGVLLNLLVGLGIERLPLPHVLSALGRLFFYQAFILLPILGIAPFFFPRFGGLPNPQASFPDARTPGAAWLRSAMIATACGGILVGTYVVEASGAPLVGCVLRFAVTAAYILWQVPLRYPKATVGTLGRVVQLAVLLLLAGLLLPGLFPAYRVGLLHLLFIGGFNLITLCVANWVIYGHSGIVQRARGRLNYVRWMLALILLALATRISADFLLDIRTSHLVYAAIAWIAGIAVWAWNVLPRVLAADAE